MPSMANKTMEYISKNHPETQQFISEITWNVKEVINETSGSKIYILTSSKWTMIIKYTTTQNSSYRIYANHSSSSLSGYIGIPYRII